MKLKYLLYRLLLQVPVTSWFDDMNDDELLQLIPFLKQLSNEKDIYNLLARQFRQT